jgi:hypothetical protein
MGGMESQLMPLVRLMRISNLHGTGAYYMSEYKTFSRTIDTTRRSALELLDDLNI